MAPSIFRFVACLSFLLAGCAVSVTPGARLDAGMDGPRPDAGPPPRPDLGGGFIDCGDTLGRACGGDVDCNDFCFCNGTEVCEGSVCVAGRETCDDGIACTVDRCNEVDQRCSNLADDSVCDDGNECTGLETCDRDVGCLPGIPPSCGDGDQCTTDLCVPGQGCTNELRDLDDDGFADLICGGTDCNDDIDDGAEVNPAAMEVCDDGIDNDCDAVVDLLDEATCPMIHDTCDTALDLGLRRFVSFPRADLVDDYDLSCEGFGERPDAVFSFTLTEEREVTIEVRPPTAVPVEVRPSARCEDPDAALGCGVIAFGNPALEFSNPGLGPLAAGSYDVLVGLPVDGEYDLLIETRPVTPAPDTDRCDASAPVISASTSLSGEWRGHSDVYPNLSCGTTPVSSAEVVHQLSLTGASDVEISASATTQLGTPTGIRFALVRRCTDPGGSSLSCELSDFAAGSIELEDLPAGVYWILIEDNDPFTDPVDWTLDVTVTPVP